MRPEAMDRRGFLALAGMGAAGVVLAGCGLSEEEQASTGGRAGVAERAAVPRTLEDRLVLYNYADYVAPGTYAAWRRAYPGTRLTRAYYASEEEVTAKLNAGSSQYDVIVVAGSTAAQLRRQGLLDPIRKEWLPNLRNVSPPLLEAAYDPGARFSVPKNLGITGFGYDAEAVRTPPRSWREFFDQLERYAPRTQMLEGATAVIGAGLQALGYRFGDTDPAHLREAVDLLKARKRFIGEVSTAKFFANLAGGRIVLSQAWNGDIARLKPDRPSLDFVVPEGPADRWTGVWAIPRGARHPRAAHAWINMLLDPEHAAREMSFSFYPVSVPSAYERVRSQIRDLPWLSPDEATLERLTNVDALSPAALRAYNEAYNEFRAA
jgi:spermidine/putrescine transport system substrate-binding protein